MSVTFKCLGLSELLPRYVFAESLYARRRVLEIGAVASTEGQSALFLLKRGARAVMAADSDLAAVDAAQARWATSEVRFRPTFFEDLDPGIFDVVMVADLSPYVRAPQLFKELTRVLAPHGHVVGGLRNPAGMALWQLLEAEEGDAPATYGQLLDVMSSSFPSVEVATQSPVLGYQLAMDKGEGLCVDGSLVEMSEASYFLVMAGHTSVRELDPTWVQLRPEPLLMSSARLAEAAQRARDWRERAEKLKTLTAKKEEEFARQSATAKHLESELIDSQATLHRLKASLERAQEDPKHERDRDVLAHRLRHVEDELQLAHQRLADAGARESAVEAKVRQLDALRTKDAQDLIAAREEIQLERARREALQIQWNDERLQFETTQETVRKHEEQLASERALALEFKDKWLSAEEERRVLGAELQQAREREIRLAESKSELTQVYEQRETQRLELERQLAHVHRQLENEAQAQLSWQRKLEIEHQRRQRIEEELERALSQKEEALRAVARQTIEMQAMDTELNAERSTASHAQRALELAQASEARWTQSAADYRNRVESAEALSTQLESQLKSIALRNESAELERVVLEKQLSSARTEAQLAGDRAATLELQVGQLRQALRGEEARAHELESRLAESKAFLTEERDRLLRLTEELREAHGRCDGLRREAEARTKQLMDAQTALLRIQATPKPEAPTQASEGGAIDIGELSLPTEGVEEITVTEPLPKWRNDAGS